MNRRTLIKNLATLPLAVPLARWKSTLPFESHLETGQLPPVVSASMWSYLWDYVDEGYDSALGRIKDNGMNAVSLACAYHTGKFLTPHNPKRKVIFLEDGTIYFRPNPKLYGKVKPIVNSLVNEGHGLAQVKKHADALQLQTNAWVVSCHNTALGMKYPEIACETAFGDKLSHNLCPTNELLRSYLGAVVRDIASHGVGRIELEALQFQGYTHGYHHEREGIPLNPAMKFLLGLCFCPSCMNNAKQAKVEIDAIRRFTRDTLEQHFAEPSKEAFKSPEELPKEIFEPFLDWRKTVLVSLAQELVDAVKGTAVKLRPLISFDRSARMVVGADPKRMAAVTGGILVPGYVSDPPALREPLTALQSMVGVGEIVVGFQVGLPESGGKSQFLERLKIARELGIARFNFYNYGFIPYSHFGWIKEALAS